MSDRPLEILLSEANGVTIAQVVGPVDSATLDLFQSGLDRLCKVAGARVLLDGSDMTYVNSRAIGLLVKYNRTLAATHGRFALCHLNPKVLRTLELLQLGKTLALFPTRDEALVALR